MQKRLEIPIENCAVFLIYSLVKIMFTKEVEGVISIIDMYLLLRRKKEGKTNDDIANELKVSRNTVSKYWNEYKEFLNEIESCSNDEEARILLERLSSEAKYDTSSRKPLKYNEEIDIALRQILKDEAQKTKMLGPHHKQALTNVQIHAMLVDMGFDIGRSTINYKIKEIRNEKKETFILQDYEYGDRFEYDFGEAILYIKGRKTIGYLAVICAPASNFKWAYLYTNSKMDVFLDSQVKFFEMLGGSFKEGVYDNMRNVVKKFIGRNEKELNEQLLQLSLYYDFTINVTNCFRGNEKGSVESSVKWIRNKTFALRYHFDSFEEANEYLQMKLVEINKHSLIEEEKKYLKPYRPKFETAVITTNRVNKYSFIQVDNNTYSVPEDLCEKIVTVKTYPSEIIVMYKGVEVARHIRSYEKQKAHVEIRHYLHTLTKKPGALRNSAALRNIPELKSIFDTYYKDKPKEFIELLRENAHLDNESLLNVLNPVTNNKLTASTEKINSKTNEQINLISKMFIGGGKHIVH